MNSAVYQLAAYGAGLAMTLVLASYLTPRAWWRRPTVRNLVIVAGGTWALGALLLHAFLAPVSASGALARAAPVRLQAAGSAPALHGRAPAAPPGQATAAADTPADAAAGANASAAAAQAALPAAGETFRVHRDLNLRADASTGAKRLATVPAGSLVTPTGARRGDWWQVRARANGKEQTGWTSSLWLRRKYE